MFLFGDASSRVLFSLFVCWHSHAHIVASVWARVPPSYINSNAAHAFIWCTRWAWFCAKIKKQTWNVRPEFFPGNDDADNKNDSKRLAKKKMWRFIYGMPRYEMNVRLGVSSLRTQLSSHQICVRKHIVLRTKTKQKFFFAFLFYGKFDDRIPLSKSWWIDKKKITQNKMIRFETQKQRMFSLETIYRSEYLWCVFSIWRRRKIMWNTIYISAFQAAEHKLFTRQNRSIGWMWNDRTLERTHAHTRADC